MSQENVENLRAYCTAWEMGTEPDFGLLDPEVVFEDDILPDHAGEIYRGHEGVDTGIKTQLRYAYVWTFRDGKVIHLRSFREREEALEAAGLRQ
jgi:hypothetical protein